MDNYSEDKTVEIANGYTDRIFYYERVGFIEPARKFAVEQALNEWVLIVDADEMVPLKMKQKLESIVADDMGDVVSIPHNNYFFGSKMERTGWGPLQDTHYRFYKKSLVELSDKIHSDPIISESARIISIEDPDEGFVHFNYFTVEQFVDKMNRYTSIEAEGLFDAGDDLNTRQLALRVFDEFKLRYISFKGYKEGFRGLSMSLMMAAYRLTVLMKLKLMRNYSSKKPQTEVRKEYQKIADKIVGEYEDY
ncbi:MAG: glycosyltransferase family 2 protein [Methanobacterium sp. ERen5]|nr:MAG: glycosyltransferase family 2 protein [Methanobacterium sp. ERen5]